jgi:hypothetical protein
MSSSSSKSETAESNPDNVMLGYIIDWNYEVDQEIKTLFEELKITTGIKIGEYTAVLGDNYFALKELTFTGHNIIRFDKTMLDSYYSKNTTAIKLITNLFNNIINRLKLKEQNIFGTFLGWTVIKIIE